MKQVAPAVAVEALLHPFEQSFTAVANAMPADKYRFSPAQLSIPGARFTGVRTFADEITHVARANYAIAEGVGFKAPESEVNALATVKTKPEVLAALAASFAAVHKAVSTLTPANQNDEVQDGVSNTGNDTRLTMATYVAVHGYDHYGQMVEYLRLAGIVPPGSK